MMTQLSPNLNLPFGGFVCRAGDGEGMTADGVSMSSSVSQTVECK